MVAGGSDAARSIVFDATHLVSRLNRRAFSGIDRVDLMYARRLTKDQRLACGAHYGLRTPHLFSPARLGALVKRFELKLGEEDEKGYEDVWRRLRDWLANEASSEPEIASARIANKRPDEGPRSYIDQCFLRIVHDFGHSVPPNALYLNVAQSGFEFHRFFKWLDRRPDVAPVFFIHDLMPLDHPEFFRDGYDKRFELRVQTFLHHARALITTTNHVADRVAQEYIRRGVKTPPLHVANLPSPLGGSLTEGDIDEALKYASYFVMVGTIEPRKNHDMILHVWREMALAGAAPKLVIVGQPGWDCAHTINFLKRSRHLRPFVRHVNGMSRLAMRKLIGNACALLSPSFDEGYGLPVVEALSLGTPAILSNIPVYREVSQGVATYAPPLDARTWRKTIEAFADRTSVARREACARTAAYRAPDEATYFESLLLFLDNCRHITASPPGTG